MDNLVLLDTSAIMYRAYFANMNFRSKSEPTGAVYGFTNTLLSIINEFHPKYMAAAFDVKRSSLKRTALYKDYKAKRESVPEDLVTQIPRIEETLDCFNIQKIKIEGCEADDVLGTLAAKFSQDQLNVIIVTGDKDLAQVLDKNITIALLGKGDGGDKFKLIKTDEDVVEYLGVTSKMIPDLFGLIGDSSDGIPGIRKVGPKKAIPMLDKFKNIEGIYENIDKLSDIPGIGKSLIQNIIEDKDIAFLSRTLATIEKDIPIDKTIDNFTYEIDKPKLHSLFKVLGFKALIKKMQLEDQEDGDNSNSDTSNTINTNIVYPQSERDNSIIDENQNENSTPSIKANIREQNFVLVDNDIAFEQLSSSCKQHDMLAILWCDSGISISDDTTDYYVPMYHNSLLFKNYDTGKVFELVDSLDKKIVSYNIKKLLNNGFKIKNIYLDTMIGYHLLTSQTKEDIDIPIVQMLGEDVDNYKDTFKKELPKNISPEIYGKFISKKCKYTLETVPLILDELEKNHLYNVIETIEHPLIQVLSSMEIAGIKIDIEYFKKYKIELEKSINDMQNKIYELGLGEFNLNSPKQLAEVLFMKLNIPPVKKTKTGLSTDVDVLEELEKQGIEIAKYLLEYRKLSKLKSTYVDPLPLITDKDHRIHTTFNQIGTTTGRLSSSDPNLQNIPVKTDEGIKIREGFISKNGYTLLGVDYSQIELRVLAQLSQEKNLIEAYKNNEDLHARTAKKLFLENENDTITRGQRSMAKVINFSIIYGKTPFGLSKELGISPREAGEYINKYFEEYPNVKTFENEIISFAEQHGYVETYFKRRRMIDGINSKNKNIKNQAERMAVNAVIQGTAAEIIKKAMISIYNKIKDKDDIFLLLQVHDELIFEIKEDKVNDYKPIIEDVMRNCVTFDNVKLDINTNVGKNWALLK